MDASCKLLAATAMRRSLISRVWVENVSRVESVKLLIARRAVNDALANDRIIGKFSHLLGVFAAAMPMHYLYDARKHEARENGAKDKQKDFQ